MDTEFYQSQETAIKRYKKSKIWVYTSLMIELAAGACLTIMMILLMASSPIYDAHAPDELTYLIHFQCTIGGMMLTMSFMAYAFLRSKQISRLKSFLAISVIIAAVQATLGVSLLLVESSTLTACMESNSHTSSECQEFTHSKSWTSSYFMWKRVWLKATTTPPSESAIKLLEEIQEQGNCCGFGPKDTCQVNLNVSKPMLLGPETSIQQCGQIKTEYCSGTALSNQTFGFDCSQSLGLDLPYLGDGMSTNLCQSRSSSGCSTAWTAYLQRNLRMFGQLLLLMALVMFNCVLSSGFVIVNHQAITNLEYQPILSNSKKMLKQAYRDI